MVKNVKDKQAELIWLGVVSKRLPQSIQNVARRKLRMLNSAADLNDLRIPPCKLFRSIERR